MEKIINLKYRLENIKKELKINYLEKLIFILDYFVRVFWYSIKIGIKLIYLKFRGMI
ncbi:MAG: hypothetical protein RMJ36_04840 [Candidatus Calescibacterium sp.]|nr:hypothetical protein [Candidatus Calescibacterium sp.]MDW8132961.1 hypothetical protein [Candidatus Calescibacterium sp.]